MDLQARWGGEDNQVHSGQAGVQGQAHHQADEEGERERWDRQGIKLNLNLKM